MATSMNDPTTVGFRALLTLAWPVVLSRATQAVIGFADALMVAPLGEEALAAATTGALDILALVLFPMGTVFILQSFAAQLRGRGAFDAVRRYAHYGLLLALCAGLLAAVMAPLVPSLIGTLGYVPEVATPMSDYIEIRLLSVTAVVGIEALGNWYGGLGNTRIGMVASVVTMVVNIAGNALLIEPRFGLPGYGVAGAAAASVIASWVGFATIVFCFLRNVGHDAPRGDTRLRPKELLRVVRFGWPNGVSWFLEFAAFALFVNVIVGSLGTTALAAINVVIQVNSVAFMPAFGLATAGAILVGESIGRGAVSDVPRIVRMTGATAAGFMVLVGLSYLLFPVPIIRLFAVEGGGAEEFVAIGASMLALSFFWQLFDAIGITVGEALRAAGDTAYCMAVRLVLAWVLFTPGAFVAVRVLGAGTTGAMLSIVIYLIGIAIALTARFLSGRWRDIDLTGGEAERWVTAEG